ncbi:hypothetical protein [Geomicrobium sp. JCM 19038]|uniref:hypothetical protein n=1 Tax=Geomicrobium sp. JCM 19038 TaxID=1460635 RepID=UPI00045F3A10|nr:hypothetical protein [Geomicrobium sp. JCM 19038]GAK08601.1 hypothetical protein JCM19038_2388 [Geomicrobium sp. JCM 19038]
MRKKKFDLAFILIFLFGLHFVPLWVEFYEVIAYYLFIWIFLTPLFVFQFVWDHHTPFFVTIWRVFYNRHIIIKMIPTTVIAVATITMYSLVMPYILLGEDHVEIFIQYQLWGFSLLGGVIASLFIIFRSDERFEEETDDSEREF